MLKRSNKTCFQNTIKVLLCFDLFLYVCNSNTVIKKMVYQCCGDGSKMCSSISSSKIFEKKKGRWSENNIYSDITFNEETKLYHCQTAGCATNTNTNAKYKYNIVKHLKSCYTVNKNERKAADNKICYAYGKEFSKMSYRQSRLFHAENNYNSAAGDEITEKGTERSQKKKLLLKII